MAKRGATEQITKDTWERDDERDSRDRSEEPAEVASQAVLAKRKILKPRSRVSGASSVASTPASPNLFNLGQPNPPNTTSLFGQPQATPKGLFGSVAAVATTPTTPSLGLGSTSQTGITGNLFGTPPQANSTPKPSGSLFGLPSSTPQNAAASTGNLFGSSIGQGSALKPAKPLFGTPIGATVKPDAIPAAISIHTPNGAVKPMGASIPQPGNSSSTSLFGPPAAKTQNASSPVKSTTTPSTTPMKANPFAQFGNPSPSIGSGTDSALPSASPLSAPPKPLFGASPATTKSVESKEASSLFSSPKASKSIPTSSTPATSQNIFASNNLFSPKSVPSASGTASLQPTTSHVPSSAPTGKIDPRSLVPPATSALTKEQMPTFNWMYQIRSLNHQYLEQIKAALAKDPYSDLSTWAGFYQKQVTEFSSLRISQNDELENGMSVDDKPIQTNSIFAKSSGDVSYPQLPNHTAGQSSGTKPSLFGQTQTTSAPAPTFGSSLFDSKPSEPKPVESKGPAYQFGSGSQTPGSVFDSSIPKPAASNLFSWNSKPSSAAPSNASSPGSVLASGSAGLKDTSAGGWYNPFTQDNPMFLTNNDDDEEEDEDNDEKAEAGDKMEEPIDESADKGNIFGSNSAALPKQDPAPGLFNLSSSNQASSSNSLFGRVSAQPTPTFGTPKTGSVGIFGNTNTSPNTWTPDKGIIFGNPGETKSTTGPTVNSGSLFSPQAPSSSDKDSSAPKSIFGNSVPSFNFSQPSNGNGLFGSAGGSAQKPATSIFQSSSNNSLAPPVSVFGGASPAPSDISTPGESSHKEGGEDENEPSDETGKESNTKDLSGRGPGEEDEDEVFEARSSIYNLNKGAYVKIGIGRLRVLKNRNTSKARVVVKVETGKVLMNVGLRKEIDYSKVTSADAESKVVKVIEFLPGSGSRVWVMKVSTVELAKELRKCLDENK